MSVVAPPPSLPLSYEDGEARPPQGKPALTIGIVLLDQFTLAAFAGFVDVLRLAGDHGGRSRQIHTAWRVMSWDGKPRCSSAGLTIEVEAGLPDDPAQFDYIAVCGGNDYSSGRMPEPLRDWLRLAAALRVRLLGICTGTFALAQADVIGPRTVCVHWNVLEAFRERFAQTRAVVDRLFVDEGDLISCAGSTAAIDLGLYLVARHCGRDKAQQAMRHMMLQGRGRAACRRRISAPTCPASRTCACGRRRISSSSASTIRRRWTPSRVTSAWAGASWNGPSAWPPACRRWRSSGNCGWNMAAGCCLIMPAASRKSRWIADLPTARIFHAISARISGNPRASISKATGGRPRGTKAKSASFPRSLAPARRPA